MINLYYIILTFDSIINLKIKYCENLLLNIKKIIKQKSKFQDK